MKIPQEIKSNHKIRDYDICLLYSEGYLPHEIKDLRKSSLTVRRIQQIVYENRDFIKSNKEWEKTKQVARVKKQIRIAKDSKKDVADLEELLRKILDGDKPVFKQEQHLHITNIKQVIENANNGSDRTTESIASPESLER